MTRDEFALVLERMASGWAAGDSAAVASVFADEIDYADPRRYRFTHRDDLLPFFDPPPDGQHVTWHRVLFDEAAQAGVAEYTYEGHHRYHGAAIVEIDADGRLRTWREWQHLDDTLDWPAYLDQLAAEDA